MRQWPSGKALVYRSNAGCWKLPRDAYCNFIYNNQELILVSFISRLFLESFLNRLNQQLSCVMTEFLLYA